MHAWPARCAHPDRSTPDAATKLRGSKVPSIVDSARDPFEAHRGRPPEASVFGFKDDDNARRFGLVRPQARQSLIAPAGKPDNFTGLTFHFRPAGALPNVKPAPPTQDPLIPTPPIHLGTPGTPTR